MSSRQHRQPNWRSIVPDDSNVNVGFRPCRINSAGLGLPPLIGNRARKLLIKVTEKKSCTALLIAAHAEFCAV